MEKRIEEAAILGDTTSLRQILGEVPLILRRVKVGCFAHTPLHVAASEGHLEFVRDLLHNNKALARVLDQRRWSALHLAAANGYHETVEVLVEANANMCFSLDGDGRNPLHLAAMEGHVSVLRVFFEKNPHWIHEMLRAIDGGGNTILHLAVKNKKFEVVELLLDKIKDQVKAKKMQEKENPLNMINNYGCTALDILEDFKSSEVQYFKKVKKKLRKVGALKATTLNDSQALSKRQNTLMVVASLMATMAFQAGITPPGGVWQDNSPKQDNSPPPSGVWQDNFSRSLTKSTHYAGESVIAHRNSETYETFSAFNTIGFLASLSTILFLMTRLSFKKKFFTWILARIMYLAVISMGFTYAYSFIAITPEANLGLYHPIAYGTQIWCLVICVLVVIHTILLLKRCLKASWNTIWPLMKKFMEFILVWLKDIWNITRPRMKKLMEFISSSSNQRLPTSSNRNEPQSVSLN